MGRKVSKTTPHNRLAIVYLKKGKVVMSAYHEPTGEYCRLRDHRMKLAAMMAEGKKGLSPLGIPWQAYYFKILNTGRPFNLPKKDNRKVASVFLPDELRKIDDFLRKISRHD